MITKYQMSCCAMCQFSVTSDETKENLEKKINQTKRESQLRWNPHNRDSGERAIIVMVTLGEENLEKILIDLNFKYQTSINRRNGYNPAGKIKMYLLSW